MCVLFQLNDLSRGQCRMKSTVVVVLSSGQWVAAPGSCFGKQDNGEQVIHLHAYGHTIQSSLMLSELYWKTH